MPLTPAHPGCGSGVVFFGEAFGASTLAGGTVILLGVYLARKQRSGPRTG